MARRWITVVEYPSHSVRYYRLVAGEGQKTVLQRHIPGGRVGNPIADGRAEQIRAAIKVDKSLQDVLDLMKGWGRGWPGQQHLRK